MIRIGKMRIFLIVDFEDFGKSGVLGIKCKSEVLVMIYILI